MRTSTSAARIAKIGLIASLYAAMTLALAPLSFMAVQFRISEILMILCFFSPDCCVALTLGCAAANLFSPMAAFDVPLGSLATLLAAVCMYKSKNIVIASLFPAIFNGLIVGAEIYYLFESEFALWVTMLLVAAGEIGVVCFLGIPAARMLAKKQFFIRFFSDKPLMNRVGK